MEIKEKIVVDEPKEKSLSESESETEYLFQQIADLANHQIPAYAYADNEAGCELASRLDEIHSLLYGRGWR